MKLVIGKEYIIYKTANSEPLRMTLKEAKENIHYFFKQGIGVIKIDRIESAIVEIYNYPNDIPEDLNDALLSMPEDIQNSPDLYTGAKNQIEYLNANGWTADYDLSGELFDFHRLPLVHG